MLIFGNGGSGKTWLALSVASAASVPCIHLDDMHWAPGHKGVVRDRGLRDDMVRAAARGDRWVMEGVYGQLVNMVLDRVTTLVWLDLPIADCISAARSRGPHDGETAEQFQSLIDWIGGYRTRTGNWNSFEAHLRLFDAYLGAKFRLSDRGEVTNWLAALPRAACSASVKPTMPLLSPHEIH